MASNDRYVNTNHFKYLLIDRISNMLGLRDESMYNEAKVDNFINSKLSVSDHYVSMTTNSPSFFFFFFLFEVMSYFSS